MKEARETYRLRKKEQSKNEEWRKEGNRLALLHEEGFRSLDIFWKGFQEQSIQISYKDLKKILE